MLHLIISLIPVFLGIGFVMFISFIILAVCMISSQSTRDLENDH